MARFQKSIGDILAGHAAMARDVGTQTLAVPEMVNIGLEHLNEELQTNIDVVNHDMVEVKSTLVDLDAAQANAVSDLIQLGQDLTDLDTNLAALDGKLATNKAEVTAKMAENDAILAAMPGQIDTAINEAMAIPLTNERFTEGSLTIWPFVNKTIPKGAFDVGAVSGPDLEDFSIHVKKFNDNRHRLY